MSMTDNEIIKALQMCTNYVSCAKCPLAGKPDCRDIMLEQSLVIINHQKAEVEQLKEVSEKLLMDWNGLSGVIKTAKAEVIKEFAERLKEEQEFFVNECDDFVGYVAVSRIDRLVKEMVGDTE